MNWPGDPSNTINLFPPRALRSGIGMNSEVLVKAAQVWVDVFDFEGVGQRPRTLPVKPTLHQAGASAFYPPNMMCLARGFPHLGSPNSTIHMYGSLLDLNQGIPKLGKQFFPIKSSWTLDFLDLR